MEGYLVGAIIFAGPVVFLMLVSPTIREDIIRYFDLFSARRHRDGYSSYYPGGRWPK